MKRILSVILSLALLASALIIPMSVSAEGEPLTLGEAAQNLIDAVDDLELDVDAARQNGLLTEAAYPVGSQTKGAEGEANVSTTNSGISISNTAEALVSKIGSKSVSVTGNVANTGGWGLNTNDLHALRYQYSSTVTDKSGLFCLKDIGYIVLYVKTNRAFKLGMSIHNNEATPAIIDGYKVSQTEDNYEPIIINMTKIDWTTQWDFKKAYMGESVNWGFFPAIESFTEGDQTIKPEDGIVFGSLFCIPVDTAVRDFKYEINSTANTVTTRFNSIDNVTSDKVVEMVVAAEAIDNADGRYTAESFAELQKAIKDAKVTLIADSQNGEANAVALFKAEAENLYKLEEVFRPKFVGSSEKTKADDEDVKNLSDDQKSLLGEHYIKIEDSDLGKEINFVDASATSRFPATPVKDYTKYRDIYLYVVNNTGSDYYVPTFSSLIECDSDSGIPFYDSTLWAKGRWNSFKLNTTVNRCDIFDLTVNKGNPYDKYDVRYFVNNYTFDNGDGTTTTYYDKYKGSSRIQWKLLDSITEGSSLILGSMMGEKPIDVSGIDNVVTNKATLIKYYAEKIANNGYANTAAVEETMELLGITTVPVVKELGNTIVITEKPGYTLNAAVVGEDVSFTLTDKPAGVDVTVKYGDGIVTPDDKGVYTITVEKGKELHIIPSHLTTEYNKTDISGRWTEENNVALGVVPKLYKTTTTRTEKLLKDASKLVNLSDGDLEGVNVPFDITFKKKVGTEFTDYVNNYTPGVAFDFNQESYDAYVDLVYDLGRPTDINKFQHIAANDQSLAMGVYQLYASDSATNLFSADSLICNYQNFDLSSIWTGARSQEIEFPTRTAQYVAIRCYMSIIKCDKTYNENAGTENYFYNCFRIGDIAIYGTPSDTAAYKVTEIQAPTGGSDAPTPVPDGDLLNSTTFESIKSFENGKLVKTDEKFYKREEHLGELNSQTYYNAGHGDFALDVVFYANNTCKNGYSIDRTNTNGNITFTVPTEDPKVYYDFTYDLGDYYKIDRFGAYLESAADRRIQAYEVYIGNDLASLYTGEPVVEYNNYYNTYGQMITFDKAKVGKYIGFRVLNPGTANDDGSTYVRLDELAAYGDKVTSATDENLKPQGSLSSESVFLWNKDDSSVYTGDDDVTEYTAARLSVKYQSPLGENGLADTSKICLANGESANIVERNVIAIAKTKYNPETGLDITTAGAKHSTATGEALNKCWKTNGQNVYAVYNLNNIKSTQKDLGFVVVGRIVYEYNGTYYTEYSPVFGADQVISAQSIFTKAFGSSSTQGWFKEWEEEIIL